MGHVFYLSVAPALPVVQFETQRIDPTTLAHMELVFYRAMVFFMGSHSGFGEARVATLQAASELFGSASPEVTAVARAWATVGVR
jgi:Zn-dependent metalloprotease